MAWLHESSQTVLEFRTDHALCADHRSPSVSGGFYRSRQRTALYTVVQGKPDASCFVARLHLHNRSFVLPRYGLASSRESFQDSPVYISYAKVFPNPRASSPTLYGSGFVDWILWTQRRNLGFSNSHPRQRCGFGARRDLHLWKYRDRTCTGHDFAFPADSCQRRAAAMVTSPHADCVWIFRYRNFIYVFEGRN